MRTFALVTLLSLSALAASTARAREPVAPHTCDGNTCKVELPPVPDPASGVEVEDPFALTPAPALSVQPTATIDLDPRHAPPPAESVRRPVLVWGAIIGAGIASVVAGALVVRRLDSQRAHGETELEHDAATLHVGALAAAAPAR